MILSFNKRKLILMNAKNVPYNEEKHRNQFYELNLEYLTWIDDQAYTRYGARLNPDGTVKEYLDSVFNEFSEIQPPKGLICILEVDGKAVGLGVLKQLSDEVAEIKRMYIRPQYRGHGFGNEIYQRLETQAEEYGYKLLRLDTAKFLEAAFHIYSKIGYVEVERYSGGEWDHRNDIPWTIFMEKKL
jgi:GNAT superfamily N-acetyltransferase